MSDSPVRLAVIGGSGLYKINGLTDIEEREIDTPFGPPSDALIIGTLNGTRVAFLPRHGRGHVLSPSEVPYRANIYALKSIGVERIVSVSAAGSLRDDYSPGHMVIPDQLYDHTKDKRNRTFFEGGLVAHVGVADPFCPDVSRILVEGVNTAGGTVHESGAFITIEGPRFSTKAESNVYRQWGMSLIGMTTSPEAFLAREAEICYGVLAHITDYDVWHASEEAVSVEAVFKTASANVELARTTIEGIIQTLADTPRTCTCVDALSVALTTDRRKIAPETIERLQAIVGRYFEN